MHTTNHVNKYLVETYGQYFDNNIYRILTCFSQYEVRLFEQAIQSYVNPSLNYGSVTFPVNWDPADLRLISNEIRPFIVDTGDKTFTIPSIIEGERTLGISRKTIGTLLNDDKSVYCPNIKSSATFYEENHSISSQDPYLKQIPDIVTPINTSNLPPRIIAAYDSSFNFIKSFSSATEAAQYYGMYILGHKDAHSRRDR